MYHPYFRGKQYDLITIRECAPIFSSSKFTPIIEPVRGTLTGLQRALKTLVDAGGSGVVIVNPGHGEMKAARDPLADFLQNEVVDYAGITAGILLREDTTLPEALRCYQAHTKHRPVLLHAGFTKPKAFVDALKLPRKEQTHIFFEDHCGKLYQRHFAETKRILLRDGFKKKKRNSDYPALESFSDLHVTFKDEGMDGFGDFLVVGDDYSESGGPAYAIAIHLTFIDSDEDSAMKVFHFVSDSTDTPKDPAGKFAEALRKLVREVEKPRTKVLRTEAVREFIDLHRRGHFPGLGYVKKLSMTHHIEIMASYFRAQE